MEGIAEFCPFLPFSGKILWLFLFAGAFLDSMIGVGFFVYGEFFFVAGASLAAAGKLDLCGVLVVCLGGAVAGDQVSYCLGRFFGDRVLAPLRRGKLRKGLLQGESFLARYGDRAVLVGRLAGPVSWVMPFLCGFVKMSYLRFLVFDSLGVALGVGQFLFLGYCLGAKTPVLPSGLRWIPLLLVCLILAVWLRTSLGRLWKWLRGAWGRLLRVRGRLVQGFLALLIVTVLYTLFICRVFFDFGTAGTCLALPAPSLSLRRGELLPPEDLKVYWDSEGLRVSQPINVILATSMDVRVVFDRIGWAERDLLPSSDMGIGRFLQRVMKRELPVVDLYFRGQVPEFAFQDRRDSLTHRNHVRLWPVGTDGDGGSRLYVGAVSLDNEIELKWYANILLPLHDIDPDIDSAREAMVASFAEAGLVEEIRCFFWGSPVVSGALHQDYFTDGTVVFLKIKEGIRP